MENLILEYINLATIHGDCTLNGDSKKGNKTYHKIIKIIDAIRLADKDLRNQFYGLLNHENDSVKIWTAATLLKTFEKKSLETLLNVQKQNSSILGFTAEMTIKTWKEGSMTNIVHWETSKI